jgi:hypothetical protein
MLQVVAVALGNLAIDCLLDPGDLIDKLVAEMLHHFDGHAILGINDPNKEETVCLDLVKGDIHDLLVVQGVIGNSYTSCGVC